MDLLVRVPGEEDLAACAAVVEDAFVFGNTTRAQLIAMWRQLLRENYVTSALVEDRQRPPGARIVCYGMGVFVSDEFVHQVQNELPPFLSWQVLLRWQNGASPVLSTDEVRAANRHGGLNWLNLHVPCLNYAAMTEQDEKIRDKILRALLLDLSGYRLKSIWLEAYGPQMRQTFESFGMKVRNHHRGFTASVPQRQPYLLGLTREEVRQRQHEITHASALFTYAPPRFGFSSVQQELLRAALDDNTDREIAVTLQRLETTIRKQWHRIYEQVREVDEQLLCDCHHANTLQRGQEKKRVLLKYLRAHPEELRPH